MAKIDTLHVSFSQLSSIEQYELIRSIRECRFLKKKRLILKRPERRKLKEKVSKMTDNQKAELTKILFGDLNVPI